MNDQRYSDVARLSLLLLLLLPVVAFSLPPVKGGGIRERLGLDRVGGCPLAFVASKDTAFDSGATSRPTTNAKDSFLLRLFASNNNNGNDLPEKATWMTRKNFFVAVGSLLVSSSILLEIYSRIGAVFITEPEGETLLPPLATDANVRHATIVFHGSGGQDAYTDALMQRLRKNNPSQYNEIAEWSQYSTNIFQASYNGERIGKLAANELIGYNDDDDNNNSLETIHLIGISVGSFCADAAARELKKVLDAKRDPSNDKNSQRQRRRPFVQLTLLDPFTQRGIFGVGYGNKVFGTSADYTQQFLNTDDPVPSTNAPLEHAVCYDITDLRPDDVFGHDWPVVFYGRSEDCGKIMIAKEQQSTVGSVVRL